MLKCDYCKVGIEGEQSRCPLCGGLLQGEADGKNAFPSIPTIYEEFNIMIRIIMFVSIVIIVLSIALTLILDIEKKWYLLVIAGILCLWLSFIFIIKKKDNIAKTIVWQVVIITILAILWDYSIGWRGWSISYVLPSVCTAAIILMVLAVRILKIYVGDYIVYLLIDALFGLIPIVFLFIGGLNVSFPSIICVATSVISISALILFKGQDIKEELNKRMHV